jgi:hypothetical protein
MSALPFSHAHCGANIQLSMDGLTARRTKSYDQAVVVSAAPLEDNCLYQVKLIATSSGYAPLSVGGSEGAKCQEVHRMSDNRCD